MNFSESNMAPRQNTETEEDPRSDDDLHTAGSWAQGLSKGVFAHKKTSSKKRPAKSPNRKQSRYDNNGGFNDFIIDFASFFFHSFNKIGGLSSAERLIYLMAYCLIISSSC